MRAVGIRSIVPESQEPLFNAHCVRLVARILVSWRLNGPGMTESSIVSLSRVKGCCFVTARHTTGQGGLGWVVGTAFKSRPIRAAVDEVECPDCSLVNVCHRTSEAAC